MKHDPELIFETRAWFKKAVHDIRMAELALKDNPAMTDQVVYHAQQSAEKAMKGFLTWHEQIFRKTHNLIELGEACARLQPDLEWQYRYPGDLDEPNTEEAEDALSLARETVDTFLSLLPPEGRP